MKAAKAFRGLTCILSLLLAISIGLTSGMFSAEGHINRFLGIETTVLVPKAEGVGQASSARYPSSFSADIAHYTAEEEDAKSKAADEFIEWEIEESAVLLRNNNLNSHGSACSLGKRHRRTACNMAAARQPISKIRFGTRFTRQSAAAQTPPMPTQSASKRTSGSGIMFPLSERWMTAHNSQTHTRSAACHICFGAACKCTDFL